MKLLLSLMLLLFASTGAVAQEPGKAATRIALVLANTVYSNPEDRLPGARRDAELIEAALSDRRLGFRVIVRRNLTRVQMEQALKEFQAALRDAGPSGVGFIYYVGHGAADSKGSDNFLLPVDVPSIKTAQPEQVGLGVREITDRLAYLDQRSAIVIVVDACRTQAPGQRGKTQLVVPDEQKPGFLVALSTSLGAVASDNSPYAKVLAEKLQTDGLTIDQVFQETRQTVARETQSRQVPVEQSRIVEAVCLISCAQGGGKGGIYAQNPQLFESIRGNAETWLLKLEQMSAETSCASGWRDLTQLGASAKQAAERGLVEAAGQTYERIVRKAEEISMYLNTATSMEQLAKDRAARNERVQREQLERQKRNYDSYRGRLRSARDLLGKSEKDAGKMADIAQVDKFEAEANALAKSERYDDATDRLVDAINETHRARARLFGQGLPRHMDYPNRRSPSRTYEVDMSSHQRWASPICT